MEIKTKEGLLIETEEDMVVYLKSLREKKGLTVQDLGKKLNMNHRNYRYYESGQTKLTLSKLREFLKIYDLDFEIKIIDPLTDE